MTRTHKRIPPWGIFLLLSLTACKSLDVISSPSPEAISECFLHRTAKVWIDTNGNMNFDPQEQPYPGVLVIIKPIRGGDSFSGMTTGNGSVEINGIGDFGRYCDELKAEIEIPDGFTVNPSNVIDLRGLPPGEEIKFALIQLPPTPIVNLTPE